MFDRQKLIQQLRRHEGERLKPYRCTAGKLTIGVGRNLDDRGITAEESAYLLNNDIDKAWSDLKERIPWMTGLNDVRQRVLLDMAFNLGIDGLMKFKNTLATIQLGQYDKASNMMLNTLWAKQVGARARRLAKMMQTGIDG